MNQERIDAARELMASIGHDTLHHGACSCHGCKLWSALYGWLRCETREANCMCENVQEVRCV